LNLRPPGYEPSVARLGSVRNRMVTSSSVVSDHLRSAEVGKSLGKSLSPRSRTTCLAHARIAARRPALGKRGRPPGYFIMSRSLPGQVAPEFASLGLPRPPSPCRAGGRHHTHRQRANQAALRSPNLALVNGAQSGDNKLNPLPRQYINAWERSPSWQPRGSQRVRTRRQHRRART
jgi:hypothetical protein